MRKNLIILGFVFMFFSCMKKVEELDGYKTNIFDTEYEGGQWFTYDDVYMFTNSFNDLKVRIKYTIPLENVSDLRPSHIPVNIKVNEKFDKNTSVKVNAQGSYSGYVDLSPDGSEEYCLQLSILNIEEEDSVAINTFVECKSL